MITYLLLFINAIFFTTIAENCYKKRISYFITSFIAVSPLMFFAGCRDFTIGTDVDSYLRIFNEAKYFHGDMMEYIINPFYEPPFLLFNYYISYFSTDNNIYLFIIHSIIIIPVYKAAFNLRRYLSPVFFLCYYLLLFYNDSLNLMRQAMAISLCLLAFSYLITERKTKYFVITLIAIMLHTTAIISLLSYLAYYFVGRFPINRHKKLYFVMISLFIISVLSISVILSYFVGGGILGEKYMVYTSEESRYGSKLSYSTTLLMSILLLYLLMRRPKNREQLFYKDLFVMVSVLSLLFNISGVISIYLYRLCFFAFSITVCISLPYYFHAEKNEKKYISNVAPVFFTTLIVIQWLFSYVIRNVSATMPYTSKILNIE